MFSKLPTPPGYLRTHFNSHFCLGLIIFCFFQRGGGGGVREARSADGAPTTTNPWLNIISFMHHPYLHHVPRLFCLLQLWLTLGNSRKMTVSNSICAPPLAGHLQLILDPGLHPSRCLQICPIWNSARYIDQPVYRQFTFDATGWTRAYQAPTHPRDLRRVFGDANDPKNCTCLFLLRHQTSFTLRQL